MPEALHLVRTIDAGGSAHRYGYANHLKVRKTDRSGLTFYYEYDGIGSSARCVRSWGDGGILHRALHYITAKRTTIVEDSYGRPTTYVVGETGIVERVIDPLGATTTSELDPITGRLVRVTDATGASTRYEWDARGNNTAVIAPDGAVTRSEWDEHDRLVRTVNPNGAEWLVRWNLADEIVSMRDPDGATTSYEWSRGVIVAVTDPGGARTVIEHDERRTPSRITFANGAEVRLVHDQLGRLIKARNALGGVEEVRYDALGREIWRRSATGSTTTRRYDLEDNLVDVLEPNRAASFEYHGFHWVSAKHEAGARLVFEHDLEGHLTAVVNEGGERYELVRDACGRTREEVGFDRRRRRYERDAVGRITKAVLPSGRESAMTYDAGGALVEQLHSDGTFARFTYDASGALVRAENESAVVELERDVVGRVVVERTNGHEVRSNYDRAGRRATMHTSLGAHVATSRDALGDIRALHLGDAGGHDPDVHFERDVQGGEVLRRFGNGIDVEWSHDVAGRPSARRTYRRANATTLSAAAALAVMVAAPSFASAGTPRGEIDTREYQWRGEDQIAAIVDAATGPRLFDHNARGDLVRERHASGVTERGIDAVGNVYRSLDGSDRVYDHGGRLVQANGIRYEHDEDGNRTLKSTREGDWHYRWNGHGMLREVERPDGTRVQFEYDAFARRIAKRSVSPEGITERDTRFVWDGQSVVHDIERDGEVTTWHWVPGSFSPLAKEHAGRRWTFATDHLGTPTEMYDDLGQLAWKMQLDVFGVPSFALGTATDCPWRWPGQYEDVETGLSYNRHRYFDPSQSGCYLSQDPIGFDGGTSFYAYVPDPTFFADPLGLAKDTCRKGTVVVGETQAAVDEATRILRAAGVDAESMMFPRSQWAGGDLTNPTDAKLRAAVEWNRSWLDPHGARTTREYDGSCGRVRSTTDALGRTTTSTFDEHGNLVHAVGKDGATVRVEYVSDRPVRATDAIGGEWRWRYDHFGNLVEKTNPLGESVRWTYRRDGLPESIEAAGRRTTFGYDAMKNVAQYVLPNGAVSTSRYDRRGQISETVSPRGAVTRIHRDILGRPVRVDSFTGTEVFAYDAEGNLTEARTPTRHVRLRYGHFHKLVARDEAGTTVAFEYDTEDQLTCVLNEASERYEYHLDKCGRVASCARSTKQRTACPQTKLPHSATCCAGRVTSHSWGRS